MPASHTLSYRVPYADTDQMAVVYYGNFFVYFERARNELLRSLGYPYRRMEEEGCMLPVVEAHCEYRRPVHYDDELELSATFEQCSPTRLRVRCEVRRDGELLAFGHTVHVCVDAASRRPCRVPAALAASLTPEPEA